jgi:NAD(P)-dependent dehydrogenase (short-subunit alcohol dehydrogenase family)
VRTSLPEETLADADTVRAYKSLARVERAFRCLKTVDLHVRPIYHWLTDRVRAHVFLCMLAYYVEWNMRGRLAPMLYEDDDRDAAEPCAKARSPRRSARPQPSPRAPPDAPPTAPRSTASRASSPTSRPSPETRSLPPTLPTAPSPSSPARPPSSRRPSTSSDSRSPVPSSRPARPVRHERDQGLALRGSKKLRLASPGRRTAAATARRRRAARSAAGPRTHLPSIAQALGDGDPIDHLVLTPAYPANQSIKDFKVEEAARAARVKIVAFAEIVGKALPRVKPASSIVLFGGAAKARPYPGGTMVTIVNSGMIGMARTLAVELAPIRVNGISPGLVEDSPRWRKRIQEGAGAFVEAARARTPTRRLPTTEDIVHGAFFLMDNRAANGIDLELDGGILLV